MMEKLQDVDFMATHIYREGNKVADLLLALARIIFGGTIYRSSSCSLQLRIGILSIFVIVNSLFRGVFPFQGFS